MRRPDGTLLVEGVLTRSGVFVYHDAAGRERREYRPPDEVFKADALASFNLVPLTDDHPPKLLTAENAKQYAVGAVGEPRRDGDYVVAPLSVFDAATIEKLDAGKRELSCGYMVDVIDQPGVSPEGERYDAIQRGICGNHVALVDVARAGREARIRLDGAAGVAVMVRRADAAQEGNMGKVRIDGVDFDVSDQVAQAIAKQDAARAAELQAATVRADEAAGQVAAEKARADGLAKELEAEKKARQDAEDPAKVAARVDARVAVMDAGRSILGKEVDLTKMTDREIQVAVVEKVDGDKIAADEHERYVKGRFDSAVKRAARGDAELEALRQTAKDGERQDGATAREKAYRENAEHQRNAWKTDAKDAPAEEN